MRSARGRHISLLQWGMAAVLLRRPRNHSLAARLWRSLSVCKATQACSAAGSGRSTSLRGAASKPTATTRPEVLWVPGAAANEQQVERFVGKIGMLCRSSGSCVVGARGQLSVARAVRSLAKASEAAKAAIEVRVRWHDDPGDARSLRFHAEMRYSLLEFRSAWESLGLSASRVPAELMDSSSGAASGGVSAGIIRFAVTPHTVPQTLAVAAATEVRKRGRVAWALNASNDAVLNAAAKALATLPQACQSEGGQAQFAARSEEEAAAAAVLAQMQLKELGPNDLVCVLRWPQSKGGTRIYAHLFNRHA